MEPTAGPRDGSTPLAIAVGVVHGLLGLGVAVIVLAMVGLHDVYGSSGDAGDLRVYTTIAVFGLTAVSFPVFGWIGVRAFRRGAPIARWLGALLVPFAVLVLAGTVAAIWARVGG